MPPLGARRTWRSLTVNSHNPLVRLGTSVRLATSVRPGTSLRPGTGAAAGNRAGTFFKTSAVRETSAAGPVTIGPGGRRLRWRRV